MAKKKPTEAGRAEWNAQRAQMRANAQRTRELAERAQAKLGAKTAQREQTSRAPIGGFAARLAAFANDTWTDASIGAAGVDARHAGDVRAPALTGRRGSARASRAASG